jgi:hypothetical protein
VNASAPSTIGIDEALAPLDANISSAASTHQPPTARATGAIRIRSIARISASSSTQL